MDIEKVNIILSDICSSGMEVDKLRKNGGTVTFESDCVIKFVDRFKKLMKECLSKFEVDKIIFSRQICYNQIYIGGMFKLKDCYYKFRSSSMYHCYSDRLQIEIMPICEMYDKEKKKIEYQSIWRRSKYYSLEHNFELFKIAKLPKGQKCKAFDIVSIKDRWRDCRKLARITGVSVCGPIYYSVAYLDGSKMTSSYITEGRLIKVKKGI